MTQPTEPHLLTEQDPLGQLLGRSPLPAPEGWFVARTLARNRQEREKTGFFFQLLTRGLMAGGLAGSLILALLIHFQAVKPTPPSLQDAFAAVAALPDNSEPTWQDTTTL